MHHHDLPGDEAVDDTPRRAGDALRGPTHPAPRVDRAAQGRVAEPVHDAERARIAGAVGEAEIRTGIATRRRADHPLSLADLPGSNSRRETPEIQMVDGVVSDRIATADRARQARVGLHEVPGEKERPLHVLAPQNGQYTLGAVRVPAAVEGQRDDVLPGLQPHELSPDARRRWARLHPTAGRSIPR